MPTPARSRALRALTAALVLAAFWPAVAEWAPYAWNDPRLGYVLLVPGLALVLAHAHHRSGSESEHGPTRAPGSPPDRSPLEVSRGNARAAGSAGRDLARSNAESRTENGLTAAFALTASAACLTGGILLGRFTLTLVGLPMAAVGWVATWGGAAALGRYAWALVMLAFMVPLPQPLIDHTRPWAAATSGRTALLFLRPLDPECSWIGSTLHYRGWELLVSEACAGSGTTLTLMVLSVFLGGLFHLRPSAAAALVVLAVPASLLVNSLRIALTGVILDQFGPSAVDGVPHELLGQALVIGASGLIATGVARFTTAENRVGP
ncbi:MAG: exosortase/archaeosortase family protein [Planctomycetota bacterium]|nr:exosortase/archaeosortase family protein [Planctomycetota bacterium]